MKLEQILESFTSKMDGLSEMSYWERLNYLNIYSISRRNERYRIIYCKKILLDKTQNCGLTWRYTNKNGYIFDVPKFKKYSKGLREQSFGYMGPKLFNSLPLYLRLDKEQSIES